MASKAVAPSLTEPSLRVRRDRGSTGVTLCSLDRICPAGSVDTFRSPEDTLPFFEGGASHGMEREGELHRDLFVRADVSVQPLLRPRRHLRLLPCHPRLQHP